MRYAPGIWRVWRFIFSAPEGKLFWMPPRGETPRAKLLLRWR